MDIMMRLYQIAFECCYQTVETPDMNRIAEDTRNI